MLVALVIAASVALVPLAYSSPPDPTWFGGFWDDDDFDDVVIAATSTSALEHQGPLGLAEPVLVVIGEVVDTTSERDVLDPSSSHLPRSPPVR